uniref:Cytochrome P450 n=1 Tax=Timema bartmani TaxID=61472 RepID=A0A7R9ERS0_9NEOP|nr:unnamed protein product [Timema bartmani]
MSQKFAEIYSQFKHQKVCGIYLMHRPALLMCDPDMIRDVLVKDFTHFHDRGIVVDEELDPLTAHLFSLSGQRWKQLRTKLTPTFTSGKMKMMFPVLAKCGEQLRALVAEHAVIGDAVEVKDIVARYTTDVIASCAFGVHCHCLVNPDAEFRAWGRKIFHDSPLGGVKRFLFFALPSLAFRLKLRVFPKDVSDYFRLMVRDTVEYREENSVERNDFMQLLIDLKNHGMVEGDETKKTSKSSENGKWMSPAPVGTTILCSSGETPHLTVDEMAAQAFVFFIGGFETSSTTISYTLYEMAMNLSLQAKLQAEIDFTLDKHGGEITYEAVQGMEYLDKVVNETLRKYPPIPLLNRECSKDYKIPGTDVVLQKGIPIVVPILGLHHDPEYYPDPEKYDPERFTKEAVKGRPRHAYLPFGMRFGLTQTKVGLVMLLSKYNFWKSPKTDIPLKMNPKTFVYANLGGIVLQVTHRDK